MSSTQSKSQKHQKSQCLVKCHWTPQLRESSIHVEVSAYWASSTLQYNCTRMRSKWVKTMVIYIVVHELPAFTSAGNLDHYPCLKSSHLTCCACSLACVFTTPLCPPLFFQATARYLPLRVTHLSLDWAYRMKEWRILLELLQDWESCSLSLSLSSFVLSPAGAQSAMWVRTLPAARRRKSTDKSLISCTEGQYGEKKVLIKIMKLPKYSL